jgi:hypothetical protein
MQAAFNAGCWLTSINEISSLAYGSLENTVQGFCEIQAEALDCVIPVWRPRIQVDTDVSGSVPANLMDAGLSVPA